MLTSLRIQNIALVSEAELDFDRGLSVLTGETGAGKSVIVTALSLALEIGPTVNMSATAPAVDWSKRSFLCRECRRNTARISPTTSSRTRSK